MTHPPMERSPIRAVDMESESQQAVETTARIRQEEKDTGPGHIALEPVWVLKENSSPLAVPLYIIDAYKNHPLQCRLQTEDQRVQEWDCTANALPRIQENPQFPGFGHYVLSLPDPLEVGYHSIMVKDKQTGEYAEMRLIIVPTQCYQPPAIHAPESRLWGLSVTLANIASQKNWGVGDLSDLNRIIDWCSAQGADFVQLNDSILDQPFNWNLLDIEAIEDFSECNEARKLFWDPAFQSELKKLRETAPVSEQFVMSVMTRQKLEILHLLYRNFTRNHLKKSSFRAYSYLTFIERHGKRLEHFALYQALQEYFEREDPSIQGWQNWPEAYHHPLSSAVKDFAQTNPERLGFYQYLQWQLDIQMHTAGLRSWEQALGIGLCLNFGGGNQLSPMELWSNPRLFAHHFQVGQLQGLDAKQTQPVLLMQPLRTDRYQFWIDSIRQPMQHAGALYIESINNLFRDFQDHEDIQYIEDLLGILALESHRQHCMVIGNDFSPSIQSKNEKPLLRWGIFPAQGVRLPLPSGTVEQFEWGTQELESEGLIFLRGKNQPSLADFWEGKDIIQLMGGIQPETLKEQRDKQITQRTLQRISILQQLEAQGLLPDGLTPDPLSAPLMTPELCAAIHELVALEPAKLFAVQLEDLLPSFDKSHIDTGAIEELNRVSVPVETWGTNARLLAVTHAITQIRPSSKRQIITREVPTLESDQRASLLIPRAIYRLQFNQNFTFRDATNLVPYLNRLGISHCYASPLLKARSGSPHGYDITDHRQLNQDIGSVEEFQTFADKLRMHGMGLILDIVPNHMGAGKDNPWWIDVLENGPASLYADYFDIDWHPLSDDLQNKILLAILGDSYGKILENGDIKLQFEAETGRFWLHYWEHQVPVDPATYPIVLGHRLEILETRLGHNDSALLEFRSLLSAFENLPAFNKEERVRERTIALNRLISLYQQTPEILQFIEENTQDFQSKKEHPTSLSRLNRLLEKQNYRLANWRVASDEINYRRFFDVNDLIAVRVEDERVFRDTHELIMSLIEQRLIQGLRIDHPDGLYAPAQYFQRLQTEAARRLGISEQGSWHLGSPELPLYILIEKILARFERLPEDWAVQGTTGYEFANTVNGLFVCQENEKEFTRLYEKFIGQKVDFDALCYESKKLIMKTALNSELGVLTYQLHRLSKAHWCYQDFTLHNLRSALIEVVACFPVYRTYVTEQNISQKDREYIEWAIRSAKRKNLSTDESVFDFLHAVLVTDVELTREADDFKNAVVHFAMKFQQYSSPVMAKGVEDTAFYRYNRLVSLNEVGGDPKQFGYSVAHFHYQNLDRAKQTPHTLLATSTHDTKRSEDIRARISVLSEMPQAWSEHVHYWKRVNRPFRKSLEEGLTAPSANDEYLFYQTLLGVWPFHEPTDSELAVLTERVEKYMLKAVREAKEHSSWVNPNALYEAALSEFVRKVLLRPSKLFLDDFSAFHKNIARFGALNSLSQSLIKLTSPGVPDIYQGTELLSFNLVDPDNRQSVDYVHRIQTLRQIDDMLELHDQNAFHRQLDSLCTDLSDSRLKQYIISTILHFRSAQPPLFREGEYIPLETTGHQAEHIVAFARCWHGLSLITVAPRLFYTLGLRKKDRPCGRRVWRDTNIILPEHLTGQKFRNLFDRQTISPMGTPAQELSVSDILMHLPVGLLVAN